MNRIKLIRKIFRKKGFKTYLEIGTETGGSFFPIWARTKIAIDPEFRIKLGKRIRWHIKNPLNFFNHYFEETSDEFFANRKDFLKTVGKIDVALVDGLHTFRAALQDTLNVLQYLNDDGVIILHDCFPPNRAAAMPTKTFPTQDERQVDGWNGTWCGDVWKAVAYLRKVHRKELSVFVLDTDLGLGIITRKNSLTISSEIDETEAKKIDLLDYDDLMNDPKGLLGLRSINDVQSIIDSL